MQDGLIKILYYTAGCHDMLISSVLPPPLSSHNYALVVGQEKAHPSNLETWDILKFKMNILGKLNSKGG